MKSRRAKLGVVLALGAAVAAVGGWPRAHRVELARHIDRWTGLAPAEGAVCEPSETHLALPTGAPPSLSCRDAKRIVAQARESLAALPKPVRPDELATGTIDWLDPHGLWSAAPDTPTRAVLGELAVRLQREIETPSDVGSCPVALEVGGVVVGWVAKLRESYRRGLDEGKRVVGADGYAHFASAPFEDGPLTRGAPDLAFRLGRDRGVAMGTSPSLFAAFGEAAEARFLPELAADGWAEVVLAAAVRAYVPLLDAHGAWAPLDEETSIYDLHLEIEPPSRLWEQMTRTSLGVRIDEGAHPPLAAGDVVLAIADVATAGLSVEQAEQLSILPEPPIATPIVFLRRGENAPTRVSVVATPAVDAPDDDERNHTLDVAVVPYGDAVGAIITIPDVPDDLGLQVRAALRELRSASPVGVVLDVRGNGGGSTDGALDALGVFLADRAMFPMRRRDGGIEIDRTPALGAEDRWDGPVAALTDGNSASAAEMIAGAIAAYRRGVVIGGRTYGKGCAQEYMDDDANAGVLRLTTLLFSLPDGSPVQKVGVVPNIQLGLAPADESEGDVEGALEPWRGPDVRRTTELGGPAWPSHDGRVGPCADETLCRALRALGTVPAAAR